MSFVHFSILCKHYEKNPYPDKMGFKIYPVLNSIPFKRVCARPFTVFVLYLQYFGDPRALDATGQTPMIYAHESKSRECAELLTQFGCPEDTPC